MNVKKLIAWPLWVGFLACMIQVVDQALIGVVSAPMAKAGAGLSWIAFQSWACYFLAGCTPKGGLLVFCSYITGTLGSIAILMLGAVEGAPFSGLGFMAVPLAVGVIAFCVMFFEHVPVLSLIPALFIASGAYFALMNFAAAPLIAASGSEWGTLPFFMEAFKLEMIYGVLGIVFGIITIAGKGVIDSKLGE